MGQGTRIACELNGASSIPVTTKPWRSNSTFFATACACVATTTMPASLGRSGCRYRTIMLTRVTLILRERAHNAVNELSVGIYVPKGRQESWHQGRSPSMPALDLRATRKPARRAGVPCLLRYSA